MMKIAALIPLSLWIVLLLSFAPQLFVASQDSQDVDPNSSLRGGTGGAQARNYGGAAGLQTKAPLPAKRTLAPTNRPTPVPVPTQAPMPTPLPTNATVTAPPSPTLPPALAPTPLPTFASFTGAGSEESGRVTTACTGGSDFWDTTLYPGWASKIRCESTQDCRATLTSQCCMTGFCLCGYPIPGQESVDCV